MSRAAYSVWKRLTSASSWGVKAAALTGVAKAKPSKSGMVSKIGLRRIIINPLLAYIIADYEPFLSLSAFNDETLK